MKNILTYNKFINEGLTDKMKPKSIDDIKLAFIKLMGNYDNPLTNFIDDDFILKINEVSQVLNEQKQNLHLISEWDDEYNIVSEIFEALTQNDKPIIIKVNSNPNGYSGGEWSCYPDKKLAYYSPEVFDEGSVWVFNKEYFKK